MERDPEQQPPEDEDRQQTHADDASHDTGEHDISEEEKHRLGEEAAQRNPDPVTRREALELELMEEGKSEAGEEVGDEID
jgi:hypothetical protein